MDIATFEKMYGNLDKIQKVVARMSQKGEEDLKIYVDIFLLTGGKQQNFFSVLDSYLESSSYRKGSREAFIYFVKNIV